MTDQSTAPPRGDTAPEPATSTPAASGPRPPRRARWSLRGRHWTFWTGLLLVGAGLAMLGWIAWQTYGTNFVSDQRHRELVEQLEREWADPAPDAGRAADGQAADPDTVATEFGAAGAIMRVPAFGDDFAVPVLEGVGDEALASGMGHFEDSARPGARGNYALAGHRITHGEPLRDMPALGVGDEIVIETRAQIFTYVLDSGGEDLRVPFTSGWVLADRPRNPDPDGVGPVPESNRLLTLTTCAELFHTDDRLVAFGHLRSVEQRDTTG